MTTTMRTRKVAGHRLTLVAGARYIASRPFASRWREEFPVTIEPMRSAPEGIASVTIEHLTYEQANKLLNAFNNGRTSFEGRVW